jgi:hypothetical protein
MAMDYQPLMDWLLRQVTVGTIRVEITRSSDKQVLQFQAMMATQNLLSCLLLLASFTDDF